MLPAFLGRSRRAFTLVEILIVVVILGILAAISIPQFASASSEAQSASTHDTLQKARKAINVFRVRNSGTLPPIVDGDGNPDPGNNNETCWGVIVGTSGEYLLTVPVNQWVGGINARRVVVVPNAVPDVAFHTDYGWIFDPVNGELWAACFDADDHPIDRP